MKLNVNTLNVNSKNPRSITELKMELLIDSILTFPKMLTLRPIVVDEDKVVLGGNMRTRALKKIGEMDKDEIEKRLQGNRDFEKLADSEKEALLDYWDKWLKNQQVEVANANELSEEEKHRFIIEDNASFGTWDYDMLSSEWDESDLNNWGVDVWNAEEAGDGEGEGEHKEAEEDDFDEDKDEIEKRAQPGDIWALGEHRLMCGDSCKVDDVKRLMGGQEADLWLTDPPYNVALGYEGSASEARQRHRRTDGLKIMNDSMPDQDFRNFLVNAYAAAFANMKAGAAFYIWHADNESYNFRGALRDNNQKLRQTLIWLKNAITLGRQDFQWKHEPCLYGWKEGAAHKWYKDRTQSTIMEFNKPSRSEEHPTMKPVPLFAYQIECSTKEGDRVLDSFGGSGTTIVACEQLGRKGYLMELDPHYCDVIIARWEKLTGKKASKIE